MHERNVLMWNIMFAQICSNQNEEIFLGKTYKVFYLKELSEAISWWQLFGSSYMEGNYPVVIIQATIIQESIVRPHFFWGNCRGGNYPGAIVLEA